MSGERRVRILGQLVAAGADALDLALMCRVGTDLTGTSGAGVMLMAQEIPRASLCSTDDTSALVEQLQFELGEGPCVDAFTAQHPVHEPDLAAPYSPRWPAFTPPAVEAGVAAVFGFPLRIGAVRLGVMDLYRRHAGAMGDEEHADALVLADIVAHTILLLQADITSGQLAEELEEGADFHPVVHQASGMVAAQLGLAVGTALVRMRAHAFGNGRRLVEVADDVVARRLRFDDDRGAHGDGGAADDDDGS